MPGGLVLLLHDHFPTRSAPTISRFLLSTLAAEAWRSNVGSAKFRGPVVCGVPDSHIVEESSPWNI